MEVHTLRKIIETPRSSVKFSNIMYVFILSFIFIYLFIGIMVILLLVCFWTYVTCQLIN